MSQRRMALLSSLLSGLLFTACAPGEPATAPEVDVRASTGVVNEDAVFTICGVPMRVQTIGKIKPVATPMRTVIAFPQTTVRLTNLLTDKRISVNSSGTLVFRVVNGILVAELRGRNVLVNTTKQTATLFVGTFVERVIGENDAVYEGTGQVTDLCTQLVG